MWHDLFVVQIPIAEKILRTVAVYVLLAALFRGIGKRGMASLNTFDFVVMFLLSNVVQNAVIGNDNSLLGGAVGAVTLVAVNFAVTWWLSRSDRAERLLEGRDTVLVRDGQVLRKELLRLGIRRDELDQAVRIQNGDDLGDVQSGSLSSSGHLILTFKPEARGATRADVDQLLAGLAGVQARLAELEQRLAERG
ncbi:MAG TPA: YetF domain-containing protein [Rugosimonospora sp.]|nr:YetF domain-containing protein [Rugosimonospora sp.]